MNLQYIKFFTASGNCYVYDSNSNEILKVSRAVFAIIDDWGILDDRNLLAKYSGEFGEDDIREALNALSFTIESGLLHRCPVQKTPSVVGITLDGERVFSFDEFLQTYSRMLTLEMTHMCNLNCEYCSYGKHYPRYRTHGNRTMDVSIAEQAIKYHLGMPQSGRAITFYGGEPLLEFEMIRHLVLFAEEHCRSIGKERPSFSLTTNGTLLSDEIIHFLAEHKFSVLISVDGDKESHDRYRRYKMDGHGSFDDVEKNLCRFMELYPDYPGRGFSLTLTATHDFLQTNQFVKKYISHFPVLTVSFVNGGAVAKTYDSFNQCEHCSEMSPCVNLSTGTHSVSTPDFDNWTEERLASLHHGSHAFLNLWLTSPTEAKKEYPVFAYLFENKYRGIHTRKIKHQHSFKVACSCIPGVVRLYCNVDGDYFPCEKVETSQPLKIGNVSSGIDPQKVKEMIAYMSSVTNCERCTGKHMCSLCPSCMTHTDTGQPDDSLIQKECEAVPHRLRSTLKEYTELMERDEHFFDGTYTTGADSSDWLTDVSFMLDKKEIAHAFEAARIE